MFLDQLPQFVQNKLYKEYLYNDFLLCFRHNFKIPKENQVFYNWNDPIYRDFMIELLQHLEPHFEHKDAILYQELELIQEILFHQEGLIDVGYEVSRVPRYVIRMPTGSIIGAWNCLKNQKSLFQFKCSSEIKGFMLRKLIWKQLMDSYSEITGFLQQKLSNEFEFKIAKVI